MTKVFRISLILMLCLFGMACEQPSGDEGSSDGGGGGTAPKKPSPISMSISPVYLDVTDSYLRASGSCRGYSVVEFSYTGTLTTKATLFANCVNGSVTAFQLPISQGKSVQTFGVSIIGYMNQPSKGAGAAPNLNVAYNPPAAASFKTAGSGVTSGGGPMSGAGISIVNHSAGEVFSGTQSAGFGMARSGLQGAVDP